MERVAALCANYMVQQKLKVFLFTIDTTPSFFPLCSEVAHLQPDFETAKLNVVLRAIKTLRFLRSNLRRLGIQTCLTFGDRYNSLFLLSALGLPIRVFVSNRQNPNLSNGWFVDLLNFCLYRFASGILAQTDLAKSIFLKRYGNSNVVAIPNPVAHYDFPVKDRSTWIVYVGRFSDQKNQADLVRIFDSIQSEGWHLYLVGDGPKRHLTEEAIEQSPNSARVTITGFEKDVGRYYRQGRIFAFTSRSEGFPNSLAEAMSAGMAVIAYDCVAGPRDLIDDNVNGFLVADGDEGAFRKKLSLLMSDKEMCDQFGREARLKAADFSEEKIVRRIIDFILTKNDPASSDNPAS